MRMLIRTAMRRTTLASTTAKKIEATIATSFNTAEGGGMIGWLVIIEFWAVYTFILSCMGVWSLLG